MLLELFVEIVLIWAFHVTFSSIITPKNLVAVSLSRVMPSVNSSGNFVGMKRFLEVGQKIVYLVLSILIESLLALNQVETLLNSLFIS